MVKGDW